MGIQQRYSGSSHTTRPALLCPAMPSSTTSVPANVPETGPNGLIQFCPEQTKHSARIAFTNLPSTAIRTPNLAIIKVLRKLAMETGRKKAAVLFSGGRDSSLAVCLLATQNTDVYLFRGSYGAPTGGDVVDVRIQELLNAFPGRIFTPPVYSITGLFRRVSIVEIESDFAKYRKNLLPLGVQLAIHAVAVVRARALNISIVASGFTNYQSEFPEQRQEAIDFFRRFMADHGIAYETPVVTAQSPDEVKYGLLDYGISTKSLEGVALFGDAGTFVETATVLTYLHDKEKICRDYIDRMYAGQFK